MALAQRCLVVVRPGFVDVLVCLWACSVVVGTALAALVALRLGFAATAGAALRVVLVSTLGPAVLGPVGHDLPFRFAPQGRLFDFVSVYQRQRRTLREVLALQSHSQKSKRGAAARCVPAPYERQHIYDGH